MTSMRRRDFLRRSLCATAASAAFGSMLGKLSLANAAIPRTRTLLAKGGSYRALVCIYLYGGNDSFNMVIPRDAGFTTYNGTRGSLAIPQAQLLALDNLASPQGLFGLHPSMTGTQAMFNAGRWCSRSTRRCTKCPARHCRRNCSRIRTSRCCGRHRARTL